MPPRCHGEGLWLEWGSNSYAKGLRSPRGGYCRASEPLGLVQAASLGAKWERSPFPPGRGCEWAQGSCSSHWLWAGWVPRHGGERQWDRAGVGMQGMEWPCSQRYPTEWLCKGDVAAGLCWAGGSDQRPPIPGLPWLGLVLAFK